jgi:hypothetical protein
LPERRRAPRELRLPVPRVVSVWGAILGLATASLGFAYLTAIVPNRRPELEARSVVAIIETPLSAVWLIVGGWVVVATLVGQARASAHAIAAVVHLAHLTAVAATFVIAYPFQPVPGIVLALFPAIAHGGASLDYWSRGWR